MGQQQLFIYILVTFVVGMATVVAIDTIQEGYENANRDALREDILLMMQDAQQYYLTHKMMDGGGRNFDGISASRFALGDTTQNGTFQVSGNGNIINIEGWGKYEHIYLRAEGEMNSDGQMNIEWTHTTEEN